MRGTRLLKVHKYRQRKPCGSDVLPNLEAVRRLAGLVRGSIKSDMGFEIEAERAVDLPRTRWLLPIAVCIILFTQHWARDAIGALVRGLCVCGNLCVARVGASARA